MTTVKLTDKQAAIVKAGLDMLINASLEDLADVRHILRDSGKFSMPTWKDVLDVLAQVNAGAGIKKQIGVASHTVEDVVYIVTRWNDESITCSCPHYQSRLLLTEKRCKHIVEAIVSGALDLPGEY